jgi:predicted esterase
VAITLEKKAEPGAKLIVMLHEEGDNDTDFDAADKPATSGRGPVQQIVTVE